MISIGKSANAKQRVTETGLKAAVICATKFAAPFSSTSPTAPTAR